MLRHTPQIGSPWARVVGKARSPAGPYWQSYRRPQARAKARWRRGPRGAHALALSRTACRFVVSDFVGDSACLVFALTASLPPQFARSLTADPRSGSLTRSFAHSLVRFHSRSASWSRSLRPTSPPRPVASQLSLLIACARHAADSDKPVGLDCQAMPPPVHPHGAADCDGPPWPIVWRREKDRPSQFASRLVASCRRSLAGVPCARVHEQSSNLFFSRLFSRSPSHWLPSGCCQHSACGSVFSCG